MAGENGYKFQLRLWMREILRVYGQEEGKKLILEALDDVLEAANGGSVCPT